MSTTGSSSSVNTAQIEKLLKMLLSNTNENEAGSDDEMDMAYSNTVSCYFAKAKECQWIIDTRASNHMTGDMSVLVNVKKCEGEAKINLPTRETSIITHVGDVIFKSNLTLRNVLFVPTFKHNMLSVRKIFHNGEYKVVFHSKFCLIKTKSQACGDRKRVQQIVLPD